MSAALSEPFSKLKDIQMTDRLGIRAALMGIAKQNEGQLNIENLQLDQFILECADGPEDQLTKLFLSLKMLSGEF